VAEGIPKTTGRQFTGSPKVLTAAGHWSGGRPSG
jgi:hypothetical protein